MIEVSAETGAKALRLVETGCVRLESMTLATVRGDTEWHQVSATRAGVICDCKAWSSRRACSHVAAAMLAWNERLASAGLEPKAAGDAGANPPATAPGSPLVDPPDPGAAQPQERLADG